MSLPDSIREHVGRLLCFRPSYGWGWFQLDQAGEKESFDYSVIDAAGVFHIRVARFFSFQGELRGIVGRVEQPGHLFDGLWIATWTMLVGDHDLTTNLCWRWDVQLTPDEPAGDGWPDEPTVAPAYFGLGGTLAESLEAIHAWREANALTLPPSRT